MATPSRINSKDEEELLCAGCERWFLPRDGKVNVLRTFAHDAGDVYCDECINALGSRDIIKHEDKENLCRCNSLEHPTCPVHLTINPEPGA